MLSAAYRVLANIPREKFIGSRGRLQMPDTSSDACLQQEHAILESIIKITSRWRINIYSLITCASYEHFFPLSVRMCM